MSRRKVSVELILDAHNYLDEGDRVLRQVESTERAVDDLGDATDETGADLSEMARNTDKAADALKAATVQVRALGEELSVPVIPGASADLAEMARNTDKAAGATGDLEDALVALDARIAAVRTRMRELSLEFARTGDELAGRDLDAQRSLLAQLARLRKELDAEQTPLVGAPSLLGGLGRDARDAVSGLGNYMLPLVLAALAPIVPLVGAAIGGAVIGGVGAGGIVGGVWAAAQDPRVQEAWERFAANLNPAAFGALSYVAPTIEAIEMLDEAWQGLDLDETLSRGAAAVPILTQGVIAFARGAMPGLNAVMGKSVPIAEALADGFGDIGEGLGDMLREIADSPGTIEALRQTLSIVGKLLGATGTVLGELGDAYLWARTQAQALKGWLGVPTGVLHASADASRDAADGLSNLTAEEQRAAKAAKLLADEWDQLRTQWRNTIESSLGLEEAQDRVADGWSRLREQMERQREEGERGAGTLDRNTDAGRQNMDMLRDLYRNTADVIAQQAAAGGSVNGLSQQFYAQATQLGLNKGAAEQYWQQLEKMERDYRLRIIEERITVYPPEQRREDYRLYGGARMPARALGGSMHIGQSYLVGDRPDQRPEVMTVGQYQSYMYPSVGSWQAAQTGGAAGSTTARTVVIDLTVRDPRGEVLRRELITDASNRGRPQDEIARAYP